VWYGPDANVTECSLREMTRSVVWLQLPSDKSSDHMDENGVFMPEREGYRVVRLVVPTEKGEILYQYIRGSKHIFVLLFSFYFHSIPILIGQYALLYLQ